MIARPLGRIACVGMVLTAGLALCAYRYAKGSLTSPQFVASAWVSGALQERKSGETAQVAEGRLATRFAAIVVDEVTELGPVLPGALGAFCFAPGVDGVRAVRGAESVYLTPDDFVRERIYESAYHVGIGLTFGADLSRIRALARSRLLPVSSEGSESEVRLTRARFRRVQRGPLAAEPPFTASNLREAAYKAAQYLARSTTREGRFRYLVRAQSGTTLPGYNWPRHAGALLFMAEAAAMVREPELVAAIDRAATFLVQYALVSCGNHPCVADEPVAELGASALALLALHQVASIGSVHGKPEPVAIATNTQELRAGLAAFLRAQQRADGEFMHQFDRDAGRAIDVQLPYYTGEASLALARFAEESHSLADLQAAHRGAERIGGAWNFPLSDFWLPEEHWTCQVATVLLRAGKPSQAASRQCTRWLEMQQGMQWSIPRDASRSVTELTGSYGVTPLFAPRLTPVASRTEASVAALAALDTLPMQANGFRLRETIERGLALLMRSQLGYGQAHWLSDPFAVFGAIPASPVDYDLRIDYAQHAGSALLAYATLLEAFERHLGDNRMH
jgi:hypothetical protein